MVKLPVIKRTQEKIFILPLKQVSWKRIQVYKEHGCLKCKLVNWLSVFISVFISILFYVCVVRIEKVSFLLKRFFILSRNVSLSQYFQIKYPGQNLNINYNKAGLLEEKFPYGTYLMRTHFIHHKT